MTESNVLERIHLLPAGWNPSGALSIAVVDQLFRCAEGAKNTAETGCGKSTLALSHASERHLVFTCDAAPDEDPETYSLNKVKNSDLLNKAACDFVVGSTQQTLPVFHFDREFDLVLLDGPHGYPFPDLEYFFFYPHIRVGGWLVVDDVHIPSVANMLDVLRNDAMFSLDRVIRTTAFFRRTTAPTFPPFADGWWEQGYNVRHRWAVRHVQWSSRPRVYVQGLLKRLRIIK
jgi:hypothetical protein